MDLAYMRELESERLRTQFLFEQLQQMAMLSRMRIVYVFIERFPMRDMRGDGTLRDTYRKETQQPSPAVSKEEVSPQATAA